MNSRSVIIFPGLDSLFSAFKLKRCLDLPDVAQSLSEASGYLALLTGTQENLGDFLKNTNRAHIADFDRSMIALMSVQIGIARALQKVKQWDLLLGCSHGDLARSVVAGSLSYPDAVALVWAFNALRKDLPVGYTANVRTTDGTKLTAAQITWLENEQGLPVSLWSEENASVAGTVERLEAAAAVSRERGIKIKMVLPLPVHSPVMTEMAENLRIYLPIEKLSEPKWPLFSSVWVRFLTGKSEITDEAVEGAISSVKWMASMKSLVEDHGITELINIGPSNSLTGWALNRPGVQMTDAWDLISGDAIAGAAGADENHA